jgi:hypothetical protein
MIYRLKPLLQGWIYGEMRTKLVFEQLGCLKGK